MRNIDLSNFEAGEDVTHKVTREKPRGVVISVRLAGDDAERLVSLAEQAGTTVSELARQAIHSFVMRGGQLTSRDIQLQAISNYVVVTYPKPNESSTGGWEPKVSGTNPNAITALGRA